VVVVIATGTKNLKRLVTQHGGRSTSNNSEASLSVDILDTLMGHFITYYLYMQVDYIICH